MKVYHSWNGRLVEIIVVGGCKKDNWANGVLGLFADGTIVSDALAVCWGSQTKLVTRTNEYERLINTYFNKDQTGNRIIPNISISGMSIITPMCITD